MINTLKNRSFYENNTLWLTLRIWQQKTAAAIALYAWTHRLNHMWYVRCFRSWKAFAVRRLQWTILLAHHQTQEFALHIHLCLKGWRQVVASSVNDESDSDGDGDRCVVLPSVAFSRSPWRPSIKRAEIMQSIPQRKRLEKIDILRILDALIDLTHHPMSTPAVPVLYKHKPDTRARILWHVMR